ncbi:beta-glucosidase [Mesoplasma florum L1]|uniref:Beta-glucosidase n=1 Tax=Mesoplasma florum (strain ATCC 33453 / NBRC 100688 / NCTC 11704 / L1) TaxID=265311 RepID=Q6F139_MESFL|nr:glycoside hydrolase family 1 protein [Mesoplasma florum]AAT75784.1 beta-glucosidase [Mesoplasma florum L1]
MLKFPKNFHIGASMSAMQTEGKGITEIGDLTFDAYFKENPELFYHGVGPDLTSDITRHYKDDIEKFKYIGLDSVRTGFSWARLFPDGINLNKEAVKFYHDYIDEYLKNDIEIIMTLFHFDMPLWAHELGGWESREVIEKFISYCEFVFKEYGSKINYFVTFNEPLVPVFEGYVGKMHYPAKDSPKEAVAQAYGIFLAHAKAVKLFKELKIDSKIGVVYNWNFTFPFSDSAEDKISAEIYDAYVNRGPLNIMYNGNINPIIIKTLEEYNITPFHTSEEIEIIKQTEIDFLGVNYYFPCRVKTNENVKNRWALDQMHIEIPADAKINPFRGWEIYPEGLYDISIAIKKELNNIPWYIAENGMGVENEDRFRNENGQIDDDYRIEFLETHMSELKRGLDAGSNCFGYHIWAAIDCWSFRNAYKNRYGLIEVDLKDQSRKFKKSAYWYKELIENKE